MFFNCLYTVVVIEGKDGTKRSRGHQGIRDGCNAFSKRRTRLKLNYICSWFYLTPLQKEASCFAIFVVTHRHNRQHCTVLTMLVSNPTMFQYQKIHCKGTWAATQTWMIDFVFLTSAWLPQPRQGKHSPLPYFSISYCWTHSQFCWHKHDYQLEKVHALHFQWYIDIRIIRTKSPCWSMYFMLCFPNVD